MLLLTIPLYILKSIIKYVIKMNEAYTDDQFINTLEYLNANDLFSAATCKEIANTLKCHPNTVKTRLKELIEEDKINGMMHGLTFYYWIKKEEKNDD